MTRKRTRSRFHRRSGKGLTVRISAPAAFIGVGTLVVSGVGVADAATGGTFILGRSNLATTVTTLTNTGGTALSLKSKSGYPPLAVNSKKLVPNLNANYLNGLTSTSLQRRVASACTATGIGAISSTGAVTCASADQLVLTASGTFVVPPGISHITGDLWGGGGGAGNALGSGGSGAHETVLVAVTPGDVVHVTVGAAGAGGYQGTAGGTSALSLNTGGTIASAGGGGGGLYPCSSGHPAAGVPGAVTAPALGIAEAAGAAGYCNTQTGIAGFVGSGGYGFQASGVAGLVIISLDS